MKVIRSTKTSIPFFKPSLDKRELNAIKKVLKSQWLTYGPESIRFEEEFANFLKEKSDEPDVFAISVNSATSGLHLALKAAGIGKGDKVAVPSITFTATAEIIVYEGATPVFIDCDSVTGNIDLESLGKVQGDIKAVIVVHLAGFPCDMQAIRQIVGSEVAIIEDAAHAFPSFNESGIAGLWGDIGVFSFYATKTITTAEGGMIVCKDKSLVDRMRIMRIHGIDRQGWNRYSNSAKARSWEYDIVDIGYKYNMTDIAAAMGRIQLSKAEHLLCQRRIIAHTYSTGLADIKGLELPSDGAGHAWHLYIVKLDDKDQRNHICDELHRQGIITSVHFIPLHRMTYWKNSLNLKASDYPQAEKLGDRILSLPLWPGMQKKQCQTVIKAIRAIMT